MGHGPPPDAARAELARARAAREVHGHRLVQEVVEALPGWVERSLAARLPPGRVDDDEVRALAAAAVAAAIADGRPRLEAAVVAEPGIDPGPAPLQVLRSLVRYPTSVLSSLAVPEVGRGEFETRAFPEDVYELSPATWADVDPGLQEPGLTWSAATAYVHKLRVGADRP